MTIFLQFNRDLPVYKFFFFLFPSQPTFHFNSTLWSNKVNFNLPGGKTGIDAHETKLPTYWNTPFSKICLGMKIGHQTKFVVLFKQASSLHSLISDGLYRPTSLGRNKWKSLIGSASLQPNCNQEGFNTKWSLSNPAHALRAARIGILGNKQNDCISCDSRIGFGTGGDPDEHQSNGIHLCSVKLQGTSTCVLRKRFS